MIAPDVKITKEQWFSFTLYDRESKLKDVLAYLVAIDEHKLKIQQTRKAGSLGPVRKSLEKFIENVIMWEQKIEPEK